MRPVSSRRKDKAQSGSAVVGPMLIIGECALLSAPFSWIFIWDVHDKIVLLLASVAMKSDAVLRAWKAHPQFLRTRVTLRASGSLIRRKSRHRGHRLPQEVRVDA
jgi:hypothetical protein